MNPYADPITRTAQALRWLDAAIEALVIAMLAFMPLALGVVYAWSEQVVIGLGAALALVFAARLALAPSIGFIRSWAYLPVAAFLAVAVLQLAPLPASLVTAVSPNTAALKTELLGDLPDCEQVLSSMTLTFYPRATLHDFRLALVLATVLVVVVNVYRDPQRIKRLLAAIAVIGGGIALLALAQNVAGNGRIYWVIPTYDRASSGPFINHSHYGQFMNLSIGSALGLLFVTLHEAFRGRKVTPREVAEYFSAPEALRVKLLIAMVVLGAATVFLSLTRGGMLAMLIAAAFTTLVLSSRRSFYGRGWIIVLLALATFVCVLWLGFDQVYDRLASLRQIDDAEGGRWQIVKDIALAWTRFPLFGVGLGTHEVVYPLFDRSTIPALATHAENEYAQAAEETGLAGLLALLIFGGIVWSHYIRSVARPLVPVRSAAYGLGFGLLAILIQSLSDFGQHLPANAVLSAVTCGLLIALTRVDESEQPDAVQQSHCHTVRPSYLHVVTRAIALVLIAVAAVWAVAGANRSRVAEGYARSALAAERYLESQNWQGDDHAYTYLISHAADASDAEPDNVHHRYWLNAYRWRSIERYIDPNAGTLPEEALPFARKIAEELHRARPLCPTFGAALCLAGEIEQFVLGDPNGARHIATAYRLAACQPAVCFAAARVDAVEGHGQASFDKLKRLIQLDGRYFSRAAALCIGDLGRPLLALDLAGDDIGRLSQVANLLASTQADEALVKQTRAKVLELIEVRCQQADAPASAHAALADAYRRAGETDDAIVHYRTALTKDYDRVDWRFALAKLLAETGHIQEAIHQARICLRLQADHAAAKRLLEELTLRTAPVAKREFSGH